MFRILVFAAMAISGSCALASDITIDSLQINSDKSKQLIQICIKRCKRYVVSLPITEDEIVMIEKDTHD